MAMTNKMFWFGVAALAAGIGLAIYVNRESVFAGFVKKQSDEQLHSIEEKVADISKNLNKTESTTKKQVVIYRDKVVKEVRTLPADDVVNQLNSELDLFRRSSLEIRPEGLDYR